MNDLIERIESPPPGETIEVDTDGDVQIVLSPHDEFMRNEQDAIDRQLRFVFDIGRLGTAALYAFAAFKGYRDLALSFGLLAAAANFGPIMMNGVERVADTINNRRQNTE